MSKLNHNMVEVGGEIVIVSCARGWGCAWHGCGCEVVVYPSFTYILLHTYSLPFTIPTVIIQLSMKMFALMAFLLIFLAQQ